MYLDFRMLVEKSVDNCGLVQLARVKELERIQNVLYMLLINAQSEDGLPIAETLEKIRSLSSNVATVPSTSSVTSGSLSNMAANVIARAQDARLAIIQNRTNPGVSANSIYNIPDFGKFCLMVYY